MNEVKRAWMDTETGEIIMIYNTDETLTRTQRRALLADYFLRNLAGDELIFFQEVNPETV